MVVIKAAPGLKVGEFAQVRITAADDHDLHAEVVRAPELNRNSPAAGRS